MGKGQGTYFSCLSCRARSPWGHQDLCRAEKRSRKRNKKEAVSFAGNKGKPEPSLRLCVCGLWSAGDQHRRTDGRRLAEARPAGCGRLCTHGNYNDHNLSMCFQITEIPQKSSYEASFCFCPSKPHCHCPRCLPQILQIIQVSIGSRLSNTAWLARPGGSHSPHWPLVTLCKNL